MKRQLLSAATILVVTASLTSCSLFATPDYNGDYEAVSTTASTTAATTDASASTSESAEPGYTASPSVSASASTSSSSCGVNLDAPQVDAAIGNLDSRWTWKGDQGTYNPCQALTWITATPVHAAGDYPRQVVIFVRGVSAGTVSDCPVPSEVTGHTDTSVTVTYPLTPTDERRVQVTVSVKANGELTQSGSVPKALLVAAGCDD